MKYTRAFLIDRLAQGESFEFLFFWGHRPKATTVVNQACLSQWWHQGFQHEGVYYRTAEHWMMAGKARLF